MIKFFRHISFNLYKQTTQTRKLMNKNDFLPYIIHCLEQRMHGFIVCSIRLYNTFLNCSLSFLYCPSQASMLCTLPMVLKGWYSNFNASPQWQRLIYLFFFTNFAKNPTRCRIKFNPIKFTIPCILLHAHNNFQWSHFRTGGATLSWWWCLNKC